MYLSSRFAACVGIAALLTAGSAGDALARAAFMGGIRPTIVSRVPRLPYSGIAPTIVGRRDGYPFAGIRPTLVRRFGRGDQGYGGYGGYGGDGLGYDGYGTSDFGAAGGYPPAPGPIDAPPPFAFPVLPAPCPQIIEIGGGLARKTTTRVVSGSPCRR